MLAYRQDWLMLAKEQMIFFPTAFRLGIHQLVECGCLQFQSIRIRDRPQIMKLKTRLLFTPGSYPILIWISLSIKERICRCRLSIYAEGLAELKRLGLGNVAAIKAASFLVNL